MPTLFSLEQGDSRSLPARPALKLVPRSALAWGLVSGGGRGVRENDLRDALPDDDDIEDPFDEEWVPVILPPEEGEPERAPFLLPRPQALA